MCLCEPGHSSALLAITRPSTEETIRADEAGRGEEQKGRTESCDQREEKRSSDRTLNSSFSASGVWKGIAELPL